MTDTQQPIVPANNIPPPAIFPEDLPQIHTTSSIASSLVVPVKDRNFSEASLPQREVLMRVEKVTRIYNSGRPSEVSALRGVTFEIHRGEFLAITGHSGSGKSTLVHIIGLIDRPTSGGVFANGKDLSQLSVRQHAAFQLNFVSFVFQFFNLIDNYTALENIMFPMRLQGKSVAESRKKAREVLEFLGMSHRADQYAKDLSGGEQQRVAVGRALAKDSEIILADEPTAHLDSHRAVEVIELLRNVSRTYGRTVILVTHDGEQAKAADHKITLRDGLVVSDVMQ